MSGMKKKALLVFAAAFLLNLVWENLHARLYLGYKGDRITEWILVRATFWDAVIVTAIIFAALRLSRRARPWFMAVVGIAVGVGIEKWALSTARWEYGPAMFVLPFLHTGLTPTIQLASTALLVFLLFGQTGNFRPPDRPGT
jgi:hypothetical protein